MIATLRRCELRMCRLYAAGPSSRYLLVITTMPKTTAAATASSASAATSAAPPAASGRSLRLRSTNRATPQIATEKIEGDADAGDHRGDHRLQQLLALDEASRSSARRRDRRARAGPAARRRRRSARAPSA